MPPHIIPLSEAESFVGRLVVTLREPAMFHPWLEQTIGDVHRYAVSISPVWTGSYRESHRTAIFKDIKEARMDISPHARNIVTDTLVREYAGPVEGRYVVYRASFETMQRLAVANADMIYKRWLNEQLP